MVDGYPTADALGIDLASQVDVSYTATGGGATAGASRTYALTGGAGTCAVTYTAANSAAVSPIPTVPVVVVDVSGCSSNR